MHATSIDLAEDIRVKVIELLNARLADVLDLQLQSKQAHWTVKGPHFIALHELFDAIAGIFPDQADDIAERIAALGGTPEGTVAAISKRTQLPAYPLTLVKGLEHVRTLAQALAVFGKQVRADVDQTADWGDTGSSDLLTGISREMDKQLWFLEAHLQSDQ